MDGRRFEDKLTLEDLLKKPAEEIRALTYMQTVKTNGTVIRHEKEIQRLEDEMDTKCDKDHFGVIKDKMDDISDKQKDTISTRAIKNISIVLGVILVYIAVIESLTHLKEFIPW